MSSTQYPERRFGITPSACSTMPTSSTSVSRWSSRRRGRPSAPRAGRRRRAGGDRLVRAPPRRAGRRRATPSSPRAASPPRAWRRAARDRRAGRRPPPRAPAGRRTARARPRRRRAAPRRSGTASRRRGSPRRWRTSAPPRRSARRTVRRQVDVGRGEQAGELLDRHEAVVEVDVLAERRGRVRVARGSAGSARPPA